MPRDDKLACGKKSHCDDKCVVKCDATVDVDLNADAKAYCNVRDKKATSFDLALTTKVNSVCEIKSRGVHKSTSDPCKHVCLFEVDLDFSCEAEISKSKCGSASKRVQLDVEIETEPECHLVDICHGKQYGGGKHGGQERQAEKAGKQGQPKQPAKAKQAEKVPAKQAEKTAEKKTPQSFSNRQYIQALSKEEKTQKSSSALRFH